MNEQLTFEEALRQQDRLGELLTVLRAADRWMTRKELEKHGFGERELRELAECDDEARIFSYPGSPGYKAFDLVTVEEFQRCVALRHSAAKLARRFIRYQRRWHRGKAA